MAVVGYPIPERKVATISASFTLWIRMTIPVPESRGSPKPAPAQTSAGDQLLAEVEGSWSPVSSGKL